MLVKIGDKDFGFVIIILCRGDREEDHRADVADENAERSKRFDEEVGSGGHNRGPSERGLKIGDASSSGAEGDFVDNKSIGKNAQHKV